MIRLYINIALLFLCIHDLKSQMKVDTAFTPEEMIKSFVGDDLEVDKVNFKGSKKAIGVFNCTLNYNALITKGLVLSTGYALDVEGPNEQPGKSGSTSGDRNLRLEKIGKGDTFDAVLLEFDFIAGGDSIAFNFFFASEEYPEYANKNLNDVFGFFLTDQSGKTRNLALLKPGNIPVSVNNINAQMNAEYFISSRTWDEKEKEFWKNNKQLAELAWTFEFDGFTKPIHVAASTVRGNKYHIQLALADIGDDAYDSAIFLEAGSFRSVKEEKAPKPTEWGEIAETFSVTTAKTNSNSITVDLNIQFENDSYRINKESYPVLDKVVNILKNEKTLKLDINGHTDQTGSNEHNLKLSEKRAESVSEYLKSKGIAPGRLSHKGYGSAKPLSTSSKQANRRVEFIFRHD